MSVVKSYHDSKVSRKSKVRLLQNEDNSVVITIDECNIQSFIERLKAQIRTVLIDFALYPGEIVVRITLKDI